MKILKVSLWSALVISLDLLGGLITQKIYAYYGGNAGIVLVGNMQNLVGLLILIGSGGILSGVTKLVAERGWQTVSKHVIFVLAICSFLTTVITLIFKHEIFTLLIPEEVHIDGVAGTLLLLSLPLVVGYNGFMHVLIGLRNVNLYSILRIVTQVLNIVLTFLLVSVFLYSGIVLSVVFPASLVFLFVVIYIFLRNMLRIGAINFPSFLRDLGNGKHIFKTLIRFSVATLVSTLLLYLGQLFIRNYIVMNLSIEEASYWQVLATISRTWVAFLSYVVVTYFFPEVSVSSDNRETFKKLGRFLIYLIPISISGAALIYVSRHVIINVIYTTEFAGSTEYFHLQLIADVIKIVAITLAYVLLGRALIGRYIIAEVLFYAVLLSSLMWFVSFHGLRGVFFSQIIAHLLYLALLLYLCFSNGSKEEVKNSFNRRV